MFRRLIGNTNFSVKDGYIRYHKVIFNKGVVACKPHALYVNGEPTPVFVEDNYGQVDFGPWIGVYDIARVNTANNYRRLVIRKASDNMVQSPILDLERAIQTAIGAKIAPPYWSNIFTGKYGKDELGTITLELNSVLFVATIISVNGAPFDYTNPCVVQITRSAGIALFEYMSKGVKNPQDIFDNPTSFLLITPVPTRVMGMTIVPNHYEVQMVDVSQYPVRFDWNVYRINQEYIRERKYGLDDIVNITTPEDQLQAILTAPIPADAVVYGLPQYKDKIPPNYWLAGEKQLQAALEKSEVAETPQQVQPTKPAPQAVKEIPGVTPVKREELVEEVNVTNLSPEEIQKEITRLFGRK